MTSSTSNVSLENHPLSSYAHLFHLVLFSVFTEKESKYDWELRDDRWFEKLLEVMNIEYNNYSAVVYDDMLAASLRSLERYWHDISSCYNSLLWKTAEKIHNGNVVNAGVISRELSYLKVVRSLTATGSIEKSIGVPWRWFFRGYSKKKLIAMRDVGAMIWAKSLELRAGRFVQLWDIQPNEKYYQL
eukprot:TRINITY_DN216_c0_g3_i1.p1 TRINITY_DN216_c0_g3~~TRINITY_DN216_c0_g3_i1.p1  ORF type:complete len:187 (-),score=16.19 TRINITY_DN216_c0_g3_i1:133-693(-)